MIRGVRGATTVELNDADEMIQSTAELLSEMIKRNNINAEQVAHVFISVTNDLDATFPAKALRTFSDWTYVPVMCMQEIPVTNALSKCIRVMMSVNTDLSQKEVEHVYLREAVKLRPDLSLTNKEQ
ncbi:chorismate mutase [Bacillus solimangrovi]|uniref:chorismate mutase n=1 Tax=Bacillus solimangrovi TaxID=1305675 RepID=A0A1E5LH98_9BACI|nr:chorismate mutase [Bacillus solimangrovi]OEH93450.1 chorismate mutase [Bacillus solimangrovi]